ncbi:MAG: IS66 family transposase [Gammaproteobacteria bacterium]|nr:IS66 family transposase [Gammaproteobacteria bacterium]
MILSDHSLRQLDEPYIRSLPEDACRDLAVNLLIDLKTVRERLNQDPSNSSVPPSSRLPWAPNDTCHDEAEENGEGEDEKNEPEAEEIATDTSDEAIESKGEDKSGKESPAPKRNPGKQPGAQGYGRTQQLPVTAEIHHHVQCCGGCGHHATEEENQVAWTGFYTIDVEIGTPGISVTNTKHIYYDLTCPCGHVTRQYPHQEPDDPFWEGVGLGEWRLVGPMLSALIVSLAYRMRMSRARIREFLHDWLKITLSIGTIQRCIEESARASAPVEEQLADEIAKSKLLHADETTHKEKKLLLWLWVFVAQRTVLYYIGYRSNEIITNLLGESFPGWLMTDGLKVYRKYTSRLRCWAHLLRKAKGLEDSLEPKVQRFGKRIHEILDLLMDAVYKAREGPPLGDLKQIHAHLLQELRTLCTSMETCPHKKARELAREFLNDWEAIFAVLSHPHLPLTNNEAERLLRPLVILRRISYGTRSENGTRALALLASVVETCRKRQLSPWPYLAQVISARRCRQSVPPLPEPVG